MKKSELLSIIREYLNEDVRKIVQEEIRNAVIGTSIQENKNVKNHVTEQPQLRKKPTLQFAGNNVLSQVLNETITGGYDPHDPNNYEEPETMMFSNEKSSPLVGNIRQQMAENMGLDLNFNDKSPVNIQTMLPDDRKHVANNIPEEVASALTRDYSKLVKAMVKK